MKKTIYILLSIAAVLGCTKTGVEYDDAQIGEITVSPVAGGITKAAVTNGTFPTDNHIKLFAYYAGSVEAGTVSDYSAFSKKYLDNAEFSYTGTGNTWSGLSSYYWPTTGSLVFAGYSLPAPAAGAEESTPNGTVTYDFSTDCLKIEGYTQSENTATTYDLLYFGRTAASYDNNLTEVPVSFKHALSWIEVWVKAGTGAAVSGQEWSVTDITFSDVLTKGDFTYTGTGTGSGPEWENQTESKSLQVYTYDHSAGTNLQTDEYTRLETVEGGTLVIPQYPKMMNVTIEYKSPAGDDIKEIVPIDLSTFTDEWSSGKKYTYHVTFSPQEILVAPTVETWPDPTDTTVQ